MKKYWIPLLFIVGWWSIAFYPKTNQNLGPKVIIPGKTSIFSNGRFASDRPLLKKALDGDISSMLCLIAKWDAESESLEKQGIKGAVRLEREEYLEAFSLTESESIKTPKSLFPQTFLSAGILAALTDPSSLQALPTNFRNQSHIYPEFLLQTVSTDADPYHLEVIRDPENTIAFVSPYSQPSTLHTFAERNIPMVQLNPPNTLGEIREAIEQVGVIVGNPNKARLLSIFVKATDQMLKNRVLQVDTTNTYLLQYFTFFSAPSEKLLMGKIAKELGLTIPNADANSWTIPVEVEDLIEYHPKKIIIASEHPERMEKILQDLPLDCAVYVIDKDTYDTTSQYLLLSYFDLCHILVEGN